MGKYIRKAANLLLLQLLDGSFATETPQIIDRWMMSRWICLGGAKTFYFIHGHFNVVEIALKCGGLHFR